MNALEGYVPTDIIKTLNVFLDFCYIARQNVLTKDSLDALDTALERFHHYHEIFRESGVRANGFSLPRRHSMKHYHRHIEKFGAPNGLCSSITESKHIVAVKKPWRRSSRYEALKQMLIINTRNNKLATARVDFSSRGMLKGTCLGEALRLWHNNSNTSIGESDEDELMDPDGNGEHGGDLDLDQDNNDNENNNGDNNGDGNSGNSDDDDNNGSPGPANGPSIFSEVVLAQRKGNKFIDSHKECSLIPDPASKYPCTSFQALGEHIGRMDFDDLVRRFLFYEQYPTFIGIPPLPLCPTTTNIMNISVFHSATATFCAPSNPSGVGGLYRETIRCTPRWRMGDVIAPRRDCILLNTGSDTPGMRGLDVARVHLLFSFEAGDELFSCALVHHFCKTYGDPDPDNGMWIVEPDLDRKGYWIMSVVHVDSVVHATHLLPVFKGDVVVPREINFSQTLDIFEAFYVNKYIDYHAFETVF